MRITARWLLVLSVVGLMLGVLGNGPRTTEVVKAIQPDVYQTLAGSSAVNVMGFETGSPVDPAPAANTAFPLTSVTADNGPSTVAHAAYVEPPATAQAATGLNNIPIPYASAADAQCNACSTPRTADADGTTDQQLDGGRVEASAGKAHAQANLYEALAAASDGAQNVSPFDQVKTLFDALANDVYSEVLYAPSNPTPAATPLASPPCASAPATVPSGPLGGLNTYSAVCTNNLPLHSLLVSAAGSEATTQVSTDTNGTVTQTTSQVAGAQLIDGLITVGSVRTLAHAEGDGSAGGTRVRVENDIENVCVAGDCGDWQITAAGICKTAEANNVPACSNDPLNMQLRQAGFNVCRLGTASSHSGTNASATASGLLVEFHAVQVPGPPHPTPPPPIPDVIPGNGYAPDPTYYGTSLCDTAPPAPKAGWAGLSFYAILGESSVQLHTDVFPSFGTTQEVIGSAAVPNLPSQSNSSSTTTTTIVNNVTSGGVYPRSAVPAAPPPPKLSLVYSRGNDRRPLLLTVFGLLELILLSNLTAMSMARRRAAR